MRVKVTERGLIAFTTLVVCATLMILGHDSFVGYALIAVVAGYFGLDLTLPRIGRKE